MKKLELSDMYNYSGGDWKCRGTLNLIRLVGVGASLAGGPAGIALGITLSLTASGLDAAGACN